GGDLASAAAGEGHREDVPVAVAVGGEGDAGAVGADAGHHVVGGVAGELGDDAALDVLDVDIGGGAVLGAGEDDLLAVAGDVGVEVGALLGETDLGEVGAAGAGGARGPAGHRGGDGLA